MLGDWLICFRVRPLTHIKAKAGCIVIRGCSRESGDHLSAHASFRHVEPCFASKWFKEIKPSSGALDAMRIEGLSEGGELLQRSQDAISRCCWANALVASILGFGNSLERAGQASNVKFEAHSVKFEARRVKFDLRLAE